MIGSVAEVIATVVDALDDVPALSEIPSESDTDFTRARRVLVRLRREGQRVERPRSPRVAVPLTVQMPNVALVEPPAVEASVP